MKNIIKKITITLFCFCTLGMMIPYHSKAVTVEEIISNTNDYFDNKITLDNVLAFLTDAATTSTNSNEVKGVAFVNRSVVMRHIKNLAQARSDALEGIKLYPETLRGFQVIASLDAGEGKFSDAITNINKGIANAGGKHQEFESWKVQYEMASKAVDAVKFHEEVRANLFAAEEKYSKDYFAVTGIVSAISRDFDNSPIVTLSGGEVFYDIQIKLSTRWSNYVAKLNKGDKAMFFVKLVNGGETIVTMTGLPFIPY